MVVKSLYGKETFLIHGNYLEIISAGKKMRKSQINKKIMKN